MSAFLDTYILSFYISFAGIIGMIGFKVLEIRSGRKYWVSKVADSMNHRVHAWFFKVKRFFSYFNRKTALALIQWIAYHILSWARRIYLWAYKKAHSHPPSKKVIDMVRGRHHVHKNSGSSTYLKRITRVDEEDKKD